MKGPKCEGCPLYLAEGPVWGEGPKPSSLTILGQNPGPQEIKEGRPFVGTSGQLLNRVMQKCEVSRQAAYVTNIVKCFVEPGKPVPSGAVKHCREAYLDEELSKAGPRVILTLGAEAFNALCSPKHLSTIHSRQSAKKDPNYWLAGAPYPHPRGYTVVGSEHPSFIARTGYILVPRFEQRLKQVRELMFHGTPRQSDVQFNYNPTNREVVEYLDFMWEQDAGGCDIETPYKTVEEDEVDVQQETTKVSLIGLAATSRSCIGVQPDQFELLVPFFNPQDGKPLHRLWCYGSQTEYHFLSRLYDGTQGVRWADGMLAYHLLHPDEPSKDLGTAMAYYTRWGYHKNLEHSDAIWYNTLDTIGCLEAGEKMYKEMLRFPIDMTPLFWELNDCVPTILDWQHVGAPYDQAASDRMQLQVVMLLRKYETFWNQKFPLISWSSPKQLISLFETLGFKPPMKNRKAKNKKTGEVKEYKSPSVNEEVLEDFAKNGSAVAKLVLGMRGLSKSEDFTNLAVNGRLRCRAKIHGQGGGRIQTVDKNVQQIPEEMLGIYPREAVIPEHEDDLIVAADFSQIEFWLYAHFSRCQKLLDIKERGEYLYGDFYEAIWGEPFFLEGKPRFKHFRDDARTPPWKLLVAKSWPLGFIYGRGVPSVQGLPISPSRSKQIRTDFHGAYPEISRLHTELIFEATKKGFLQTSFGRMRRFSNPQAQRNALLAFPGQTTAVDILVQKVINGLARTIQRDLGERSRLYFTVHDSGIFNIHGARRDKQTGIEAVEYIKSVMESPIPQLDGFRIPAEVKIGPSWGRVQGVDKYASSFA